MFSSMFGGIMGNYNLFYDGNSTGLYNQLVPSARKVCARCASAMMTYYFDSTGTVPRIFGEYEGWLCPSCIYDKSVDSSKYEQEKPMRPDEPKNGRPPRRPIRSRNRTRRFDPEI